MLRQPQSKLFLCACTLGLFASTLGPQLAFAQHDESEGPTGRPKGKVQSLPAAPELIWQLPNKVDKSYGTIDGERMLQYVKEQAAISEKDRASGTKWWGRIAGMPSGIENTAWVTNKLKNIHGLEIQSIEIPMTTQRIPRDWDVTVTGGGQTLKLESAFPAIDFATYMPLPKGSEDLDMVWVGLGQASDFVGKDVRGKAVVIYSIPTPSTLVQSAAWMGSVERAQKGGAKAIIIALAIPGNMKYVSHLTGATLSRDLKVPIFTIGNDDGTAVEALNAQAMSSGGSKMHVSWDVSVIDGLKENIVLGKLPGMTNEKILMIAHTDGYFDGATDDGAGVAALIETANYFAKMPKEKRRRTMYFIALPDHHGGDSGGRWLHENIKTMFPDTAVLMNAEHIAAKAPVYDRPWGSAVPPMLIPTNGIGPSWWGVNGSPKLAQIVRDDYAAFGVPTQMAEGGSPGELAQTQWDAPSFYLHNKGVYYHADSDTPDVVPAEGMRNAVQAITKIFNDVNKVDLKDLQPGSAAGKTASAQ